MCSKRIEPGLSRGEIRDQASNHSRRSSGRIVRSTGRNSATTASGTLKRGALPWWTAKTAKARVEQVLEPRHALRRRLSAGEPAAAHHERDGRAVRFAGTEHVVEVPHARLVAVDHVGSDDLLRGRWGPELAVPATSGSRSGTAPARTYQIIAFSFPDRGRQCIRPAAPAGAPPGGPAPGPAYPPHIRRRSPRAGRARHRPGR